MKNRVTDRYPIGLGLELYSILNMAGCAKIRAVKLDFESTFKHLFCLYSIKEKNIRNDLNSFIIDIQCQSSAL